MIRMITGNVCNADGHQVVVEVNGIGYLVTTTKSPLLGDEVTFYTYLAVRETALDLYGFLTKEELDVFELLLGLPKIGPKSAKQILAQADVSLLQQAIISQDAVYLSKMSGIGKKTSEKIVQGLKDKIDFISIDNENSTSINTESASTIEALVTLGYSEQISRETVQSLQQDTEHDNSDVTILLKEALRILNK